MNFKDKVNSIIDNNDINDVKSISQENNLYNILKVANTNTKTGEVDWENYNKQIKELDKKENSNIKQPTTEATFATTPDYVNALTGGFIGTTANDGSGFKIGQIKYGDNIIPTRLVINYKNTSALLCTKYGNFDFNELNFENFEEVELNGVVFKRLIK